MFRFFFETSATTPFFPLAFGGGLLTDFLITIFFFLEVNFLLVVFLFCMFLPFFPPKEDLPLEDFFLEIAILEGLFK